jgi:ubiquinone/menaquinone biosynthesis C-methylase UbiE
MEQTCVNAAAKEIQLYQDILNDLGIKLNSNSMLLDFGCGAGNLVYQFREMGFNAFGVDIKDYSTISLSAVKIDNLNTLQSDIIQLIDIDNYRIPFEDNTFDFVFSSHVFEHVHNFSEAISEIQRVLKPGGCSLHFFPPKYRPIEGHVYVPFAGVFQEYFYLLFWAFLGIRNEYQRKLNFKKVAELNAEYLKACTNYPSPSQVNNYFQSSFQEVFFLENLLIKYSYGSLRSIYALTKIFPFIPLLVRTFHERVVFARKSE